MAGQSKTIQELKIEIDALRERISALEAAEAESKRMEDSLRRSQQLFSTIFRANPAAVILSFLSDGKCVDANEAYIKLTGFEREELIGKTTVALNIWASSEERQRVVAELAEKGHLENVELTLRRKSGELINTIAGGEVITLEGQRYIVSFFLDITERKRTVEALRESEEKYRVLVETAGESIFIAQDGMIRFCNKSFSDISGYEPADLANMAFSDLVHPDDRQMVFDRYNQRLERRDVPSRYRFRFVDARGKTRWADMSVALISWDGKPASLCLAADITELKEAEEEHEKLKEQLNQAQKMEAIGQLAGGVAHDFNNMLNIILGYSQLALMKIEPSSLLKADLQEIINATQRSTELVRQLLAFARKQTITPKALDLNDTVAGMLNMLRRLIGEDIDLFWVPAANLWPVKMDPTQVDQILANLSVNARDSISGIGKITIETGKAKFDDAYCGQHPGCVPGQYVMLAVSDNGSGMDKETCEKIFEPFFTTKEIGKGTGMGLATVYGIVKQNNGFVNVYSEPEKGTTFKIYLPRHGNERPAIDEPLKQIKPLTGKETVLLVEDNEALLKMSKIMLEELGYTVLAAGSPNEAIKLAEQYAGDIHLLVTDVVMPEMSGRELQKRLSAPRPDMKYLFMSGYTANVIAHRSILDEGVNFLQKPFLMDVLATKVREALE